MVGSFVYPVLVEPAFNHFTPLPDGPLRTQILQVAADEHVHLDDVLVADASRRTTTLNAYVSGYGSTRRVVLYDNVLHDLPRDQVISIVAHELGHARHDDVLTGSLLAALGDHAGDRAARPGPAAGTPSSRRACATPTVVPLVLALVAIGTLLSSPVNNGLSRLIETRADVDVAPDDAQPRRRSSRCRRSSPCTRSATSRRRGPSSGSGRTPRRWSGSRSADQLGTPDGRADVPGPSDTTEGRGPVGPRPRRQDAQVEISSSAPALEPTACRSSAGVLMTPPKA